MGRRSRSRGRRFASLYHPRMRRRAPIDTAATAKPPVADATEISDDAARVLRRFRLVFNAVKTHFQQVERRTGLGGAQLWALSIIRQRPGIGVGDLSKAMDIHQSTASNLVKSLMQRGLIASTRDGPDRRMVQLRTLAPGSTLLRKAPGPSTGVLPQALAQLDPKALKRLDVDLARLITLLGADERGANIPLGQ